MRKIRLIAFLCVGTWAGVHATAYATPQVQISTETPLTAPVFRDADVNKGLAAYKNLLESYTKALDKKDHTLMEKYAAQITQWQDKTSKWMAKMDVEEQTLFMEYTDALNKKYPVQEEGEDEHDH